MHSAVLLAKDNADLRAANEKKRQKHTRSTQQIPHEGGLTVEEASRLIQQPYEPIGRVQPPPPGPIEPPILPPPTVKRAPPRCSGCGNIGHSITWCPSK